MKIEVCGMCPKNYVSSFLGVCFILQDDPAVISLQTSREQKVCLVIHCISLLQDLISLL